MKTRTKVVLDAWAGRALVVTLNLVARLLGKILSINHEFSPKPSRIVVCKFLGMGSIIQATPLLKTLRKNFPDTRITFLTARQNETLLKSVSMVDDVIVIDDSSAMNVIGSTFKALANLWKKKADVYIDLETYSYYSTALATLSCARNRLGFYRIERNIRMGVHTHMMFFNARAPISESYLQMARLAGCTDIDHSLYRFPVNEADSVRVMKRLKEVTGKDVLKLIVINPNASDLRVERRWPLENFAALMINLHTDFPDYHFVLTGSPSEKEWVDAFYEMLPVHLQGATVNTAGWFSLPELFALLDNATMIITNDTGPMHISFSLGKPTVSLFGPASPSQYGQNANAFGIYKNIYCSPCVHDFLTPPCRGDNQCMKQITVEEVFRLAVSILRNHQEKPVLEVSPMNFTKEDGKTSLGIVERI